MEDRQGDKAHVQRLRAVVAENRLPHLVARCKFSPISSYLLLCCRRHKALAKQRPAVAVGIDLAGLEAATGVLEACHESLLDYLPLNVLQENRAEL